MDSVLGATVNLSGTVSSLRGVLGAGGTKAPQIMSAGMMLAQVRNIVKGLQAGAPVALFFMHNEQRVVIVGQIAEVGNEFHFTMKRGDSVHYAKHFQCILHPAFESSTSEEVVLNLAGEHQSIAAASTRILPLDYFLRERANEYIVSLQATNDTLESELASLRAAFELQSAVGNVTATPSSDSEVAAVRRAMEAQRSAHADETARLRAEIEALRRQLQQQQQAASQQPPTQAGAGAVAIDALVLDKRRLTGEVERLNSELGAACAEVERLRAQTSRSSRGGVSFQAPPGQVVPPGHEENAVLPSVIATAATLRYLVATGGELLITRARQDFNGDGRVRDYQQRNLLLFDAWLRIARDFAASVNFAAWSASPMCNLGELIITTMSETAQRVAPGTFITAVNVSPGAVLDAERLEKLAEAAKEARKRQRGTRGSGSGSGGSSKGSSKGGRGSSRKNSRASSADNSSADGAQKSASGKGRGGTH